MEASGTVVNADIIHEWFKSKCAKMLVCLKLLGVYLFHFFNTGFLINMQYVWPIYSMSHTHDFCSAQVKSYHLLNACAVSENSAV